MDFEFDLSHYRLHAVQKAAYRFSACYAVRISQLSAGRLCVSLTQLEHPSGPLLDVDQFPNEVLDQELRELVADETRPISELLLAQAFSGLQLTDPTGETGDPSSDPLAIRASQYSRDRSTDGNAT